MKEHPEKCVAHPDTPCHLYGKGYKFFEEGKCKDKPCPVVTEAVATGISLSITGGSKRACADTLTHYKVLTTKTDDEVIVYLTKKFRVGSMWYQNKIESFRPLTGEQGYAFTLRDPYKD